MTSFISLINLVIVCILLTPVVMFIVWMATSVWSLLFRLYRKYATKRLNRTVSSVDELDWYEFEHYVADGLKRLGFTNVHLTEKYDLGVDIVASKNGHNWGVQVKHYSNLVGADAVRQVVTALNTYGCDKSMVVTNNFFSRPAQILAKSNECVLIDRRLLSGLF